MSNGNVTSIRFDRKTADLLDQLKLHYGATSYGEVIRKAVALLSLASAAEEQNARLLIKGKYDNGEEYTKEIIVS